MMRKRWLWACGVSATCLLCSCGDSQQSSTPNNKALGGKQEGAPLPQSSADPGILGDQTAYQPPRPPGASGVSLIGKAAAGDVHGQVLAAVGELVNALRSGQVDAALKLFRDEDVAALSAQMDALFKTCDQYDRLTNALREKLGAGKLEQLPLPASIKEPKPTEQDEAHATATPNVTQILFGPERGAPTTAMLMVLEDGKWKFRLDKPLSAADVEAIVAFHQKVQSGLEKVMDWVDTHETPDVDQLTTALMQVMSGEAVTLSGGPTTKPAAEPGEKPAAAPGGKPAAEPTTKPAGEKPPQSPPDRPEDKPEEPQMRR